MNVPGDLENCRRRISFLSYIANILESVVLESGSDLSGPMGLTSQSS